MSRHWVILSCVLALLVLGFGSFSWSNDEEAAALTNDAPTIAFSPNGKFLVTGGFEKNYVSVWDTEKNEPSSIFKCDSGIVRSVAFSPDSKTLAGGTDEGVICIWEPATWELRTQMKGHAGTVIAVVFSPDGQTIAAASAGSANGKPTCDVRLWDVSTGNEKHTLLKGTGGILSIAFSPDGKTLATALTNVRHLGIDRSGSMLWDVKTGTYKHEDLKK